MDKNFKEFYQAFNLIDFPFNTFTTEHEITFSKKLFITQGEYDPIIDTFKAGRNIILLGERGSGKTAILENFKRYLFDNKRLTIIIYDYKDLNKPTNSNEIYKLLISNFLIELFTTLGKTPFKLFKLNKEERILLSYLLSEYLPIVSQNLLKDKISKIQIPFWIRFGNGLYNKVRSPLNLSGTVAKNIAYEYILCHFSFLPPVDNSNQIHEFFPELKINVDNTFFDQEASFQLLKKIGDLSSKMGLQTPVFLLDRLDEDPRFENDAEIISEFITPFLTDNNLLSISEFQLIFFVWSTPFRFIQDLVRTQKYYCPSLRWTQRDLEKLLNRRLEVYSGRKVSDYKTLFDNTVTKEDLKKVFDLANSNPRDLIHIFKILFEEQYRSDPDATVFNIEILNAALIKFVLDFNYYEYYPRKSNARANSMDIYSYAAHLLKLEAIEFSKNQLNEKAGTGSSTNNYVVGMERIGLIENIGQEKGNAVYKIKDPKIIYCQQNKLDLKR